MRSVTVSRVKWLGLNVCAQDDSTAVSRYKQEITSGFADPGLHEVIMFGILQLHGLGGHLKLLLEDLLMSSFLDSSPENMASVILSISKTNFHIFICEQWHLQLTVISTRRGVGILLRFDLHGIWVL